MIRRILALVLLATAVAPALAQEATAPQGPRLPSIDVPLIEMPDMALDGISAPPQESSGDRAFAAYQTGYYYLAYKEALERIEHNPQDAAAMTLLGELYGQGLGIPIDPAAAAQWYALAAERGDVNAMVALALHKLDGIGTARDPKGAVALLEKAAEHGNRIALFNLGMMSLSGNAQPLDEEKARERFLAAAEQDEPEAQYALAILLKEGRGGPVDEAASVRWMARAAAGGHVIAKIEYAIALFNGRHVTADEAEAARLLEEAAATGNAIAQNRLARLYAAGRGVRQDGAKAMAWHILARTQGRGDAWLDGFVENLDARTRQNGLALLEHWRGSDPLALDVAQPTGQVTGEPDTTNIVSEP